MDADQSSDDRRLRFASFLSPVLWPFYRAVAEYVGRQTGRDASLVAGTSFEQFAAGEVDAGFI